jgi:hypothetical protein
LRRPKLRRIPGLPNLAVRGGRGLSTMIASWSIEWAERHAIKRAVLATLDAHGVYAKAGFVPAGHPERWMEIDNRPPFG